jgi:hypothetical protein
VHELPAIAKRHFDAWVMREPASIAACFADDGLYIAPTRLSPLRGPAAIMDDPASLFAAIPDFSIRAKEWYVSPDARTVGLFWRVDGTFTGPLDPPGFAPTDSPIAITGFSHTLIDARGRIARFQMVYDLNDLGRQICAVPAPGSAGERVAVALQRRRAKARRRRTG